MAAVAFFRSLAALLGTTHSARLPGTVPVEPGRPIASLSRRCSPVKEKLICLKFRLREQGSVKSARITEGWRPTGGFRAALREERCQGGTGAHRNDPERRVNPSAPFIGRPVATTLLTIAIAIAGLFAFLRLPGAPLPQVDYPTILVTASMPGASPNTM